MKTNRIWLHMSRGFLSVCGTLCMFYAIKFISLSDVTAVQYLEQIVLLIISIFYFKERATKTKFFVIIISFIGAILIIQPGFFFNLIGIESIKKTQFNSHYIFVFLAIGFWSLNSTVIKILGKTEKTKVQSFYVLLFSVIIAFPIALMEWKYQGNFGIIEIRYPSNFIDISQIGITTHHLLYIALLAACYFLHLVGHFKALKHADLSVVIPFEYTRLVFAALFGYMFFSEYPTTHSYIGYALIIGAGLYLFRSEHRKIKRKKITELESQYSQS